MAEGRDDDPLAKTREAPAVGPDAGDPVPLGYVFAGRYVVTGRLGAGGMGIVYAGLDDRTSREVAIKVLNPSADTVGARRFRREAEAAFSLKHQHLCEVLETGFASGLPFIVMERLEGETLLERIKRDGRLAVPDAMRIAIQVLEALAAAHAIGVIHRDVKPGNIFVLSPPGADPWTKLIDFGVAKALPESDREGEAWTPITALNMVPGTPAYLSPEQLRAEPDLDGRVDLWALGVTLFEMLAARRPFDARMYGELTRRIVADTPPRITALRPDVPLAVERVIHKALAKDRAARFGTAQEMRAALVDILSRPSFDLDSADLQTTPLSMRAPSPPSQPPSDAVTTKIQRRHED